MISLPIVAEKDETWTFPVRGRVVHRKEGELLWPERFNEHAFTVILADKIILGEAKANMIMCRK